MVAPDNRDAYLGHIDGLPLGSSRAQGTVRGSRFYHGDMGITVAFPTGWIVENQPGRLLAYPEGKQAFMEMRRRRHRREWRRGNSSAACCKACPPARRPPGGRTACRATRRRPQYQAALGQPGTARISVVYFNNLAYVFTGATQQTSALSSLDPLFLLRP